MLDFLRSLFADAVASGFWVVIFSLPSKRARAFASLDAAAVYAEEESMSHDVYCGVALTKENLAKKSEATDAAAIIGLWADIDMVAPHRPDKPLPKSREEVDGLLAALPFPPSMVVDSGYGIHAYWQFKEPWVLDSEEVRAKAGRLAKGWHGRVCSLAAERGWRLENLGDLARVLRVAGTFNRKGSSPVSVRVLESHAERRYNPIDFEPFEAVETAPGPTAIGDLILRPDAEPPIEKFAALRMNVKMFEASWNRARPDLQDQSQSAYDQSLANIAVLNDWSDQEAADLLIAARRKHGKNPEKALRHNYVSGTIANARESARQRQVEGVDLSEFCTGPAAERPPAPRSLKQLTEEFKELRAPVIDGLLRQGETMNVIAAPKLGKTWLVTVLAMAVATGTPWLGFKCAKGKVLLIDNELHPETSAHRLREVAAALGIPLADIADRIFIENMRGRLQDLTALGPYLEQFEPGEFSLVILDAFYRFLPERSDENDNGTMATLYNHIDSYADRLKCSFVLIHHTSKGNQSSKDVTDVGAGAGAQSRATDTHLILRRHECDDVSVMDANARSFAPVAARCLRYRFPLWHLEPGLDPTQLKKEGGRKKKPASQAELKSEKPAWTCTSFIHAHFSEKPKSHVRAEEEAVAAGISRRQFQNWLKLALEDGMVFAWDTGSKAGRYATLPPPAATPEPSAAPKATKRDLIERLLRENPELGAQEIARAADASEKYVRIVKREQAEKANAT